MNVNFYIFRPRRYFVFKHLHDIDRCFGSEAVKMSSFRFNLYVTTRVIAKDVSDKISESFELP